MLILFPNPEKGLWFKGSLCGTRLTTVPENQLRGLGCGPLKEPGKQMSSILDAQFRTYGEMKPLEVS